MKTILTPSFSEERFYWDQGIPHVIGIDEVGVGCFAGPVVVAGVVFDAGCSDYFEDKKHELYNFLHEINDSKVLLRKTRELLAPLIQKHCLFWDIAEIPVKTINQLGIRKATFVGMKNVFDHLTQKCHPRLVYHENAIFRDRGSISTIDSRFTSVNSVQSRGNDKQKMAILVDGFKIPDLTCLQKPIVKGDQISISISAASIIAKVYRDTLMKNLAVRYPQYGFEKNKGYGTKDHRDAIKEHGLSDIHRSSFNLYKFL